jgi:hypothetical protein
MTRSEARAIGATQCEGRPCYRCGTTKKWSNNSSCVKCQYDRQHTPEYKKKEQTPRRKAQKRAIKIKCFYGITEEQYQELMSAQSGVCAICKGPNVADRRLGVDHDHITNAVRGLLCINCNYGLGYFKDNPDLLIAAINYLKVAV